MTNAQDFREAASNAGAEDIYSDGSQEFSMSEDDGAFFISQFGLRACFDIGQDSTRAAFNRRANVYLRSMGYDATYKETGIV